MEMKQQNTEHAHISLITCCKLGTQHRLCEITGDGFTAYLKKWNRMLTKNNLSCFVLFTYLHLFLYT